MMLYLIYQEGEQNPGQTTTPTKSKQEREVTKMLREKMVTRTITNAVATVMTANVETATVQNVIQAIPEQYAKDNTSMLKYLNKYVDTENNKSVAIIKAEVVEQLYGMTEGKFIANATPADTRTTTREKMVTRTITNAVATVMTANVETATVQNVIQAIPEQYAKDNTSMLKYLNKYVDTENNKSVAIIKAEVVEQLYIMPEQKFIALAEALPARGTKANDK